MRVLPQVIIVTLLVGITTTAGCDAVERARSRVGTTDTISNTATGSGLALGLQAPGTLSPGDEGILRLSLTNRTDTVVSQVSLELIVPGWAEPMPPRIGDRPVNMSAMEDGGTRFTYGIADTPLEPEQVEVVEQRIRVPVTGLADGRVPWTRTIRARLIAADGRPLAEVESEIGLDSATIAAARAAAGGDTLRSRDRLGPLQLGMTAASVRQAAANTRDTSWTQEGMQEQGVLVPVGNGTALAVVSGNAVTRIEVADPQLRTAERLGVGSRMEELRAAYGTPCVDVGEGRVVVWFADAPGISYALDMPVPQNPVQLRANPDAIPDGVRVTRWWLRRGVDRCPGA